MKFALFLNRSLRVKNICIPLILTYVVVQLLNLLIVYFVFLFYAALVETSRYSNCNVQSKFTFARAKIHRFSLDLIDITCSLSGIYFLKMKKNPSTDTGATKLTWKCTIKIVWRKHWKSKNHKMTSIHRIAFIFTALIL